MWRLLHPAAADHGLCLKQSRMTPLRQREKRREKRAVTSFRTEMSDELLCNVHPLEELLKEAIGETLLNGGDVLLHVLQSPKEQRRSVLDPDQLEDLRQGDEAALLAWSLHIHSAGGTSAGPEPSPCPGPSPWPSGCHKARAAGGCRRLAGEHITVETVPSK